MKYPLYKGQEVLFNGRGGPLYSIIMYPYMYNERITGDFTLLMEDDLADVYVVSSEFVVPWELRNDG